MRKTTGCTIKSKLYKISRGEARLSSFVVVGKFTPPASFRHSVGAGHARPATSPLPAVNLPPPTPPIICARQPRHPNIHLAQTSPSNFVEKIKKTCKNLLTKVILLAIIIKLSREPSPRRQPLEPLPTACTPFFEENFFKKLSENLLTNERI